MVLTVATSFTADPLEPTLRFWLDELGIDARAEFAPYNQVLRQLLDPVSALGRNATGVNIIIVRLEDWTRFRADNSPEAVVLEQGVDELADAIREFAGRAGRPLIVSVCPPSSRVSRDTERSELHISMITRLREEIAGIGAVSWLEPGLLGLDALGPGQSEDARRDEIGHMPYTPLAYTAIATALARRIDALKSPRFKVIAIDCDNTLWKGVVGEEGPSGVTFPAGLLALQRFVVGLQESGLLLCLLSKNVESDVHAVFNTRRDEMPLKREHVVAERVNWQPKSQNIAELARELNLGLDSFVFIDDNPVECAEMHVHRPEVLTLQLPSEDAEIAPFLRHLWALDILKVTDEDRRRSSMYRENAERDRSAREAGGIQAFLAKMELKIDIDRPAEDEWSRVAQLTQKTNQFNFTTVRRDEAQIRQLGDRECLRVKVADRFGDYGLVGVMIFSNQGDAIEVDTFLLSCRVLARGVEHAMMARLGKLALERGRSRVERPVDPHGEERTRGELPRIGGLGLSGDRREGNGLPIPRRAVRGPCL